VSKTVKIILAAAVVVLVVGGAGFWYFVLRDDAPAKASLDAIDQGGSSTTTGGKPVTLDGTWNVEQGEDVFVGYRVQELFAGDTIKKTAAGWLPFSAWMDRTKAMSSTQVAKCGNRSDTGMPHFPYCLNSNGLFKMRRGLAKRLGWSVFFSLLQSITVLSNFDRAGLGSKVST